MKRTILIAIVLLTSGVVLAQNKKPDYSEYEAPATSKIAVPVDDGEAAYELGLYEKALKHFRSLAYEGSHHAQNWLGIMYYEGKGVLKDLVMAYVWWNVSAANGNDAARENRDALERGLDKSQLKQAQKLSKLCLKKPTRCPEYID